MLTTIATKTRRPIASKKIVKGMRVRPVINNAAGRRCIILKAAVGLDFRLRARCRIQSGVASPRFQPQRKSQRAALEEGVERSGEDLAPALEAGQLLRTCNQATQ